ncbi:lipoyl domain-containing protein [Pedobacter nutrimenti]|uniref:lipoyl domain-containing protein n=1 Tax=Pedobacter nutrimenti TaxID=1241337 RepID=UPI00292DD989|nr:lipoyl domain-containing protein [Pedobacter nutrimenti]
MQDYYKLHADALYNFKNEARKAFSIICSSFGLKEENIVLTEMDNLFQIRFSNHKIRIVVEGVNWGMNTNIHFGINAKNSPLYSILQLIKERKPAIPVEGNQIDQLYGYSHYLMTYAADILKGETNFFDQQEELARQEKEDSNKALEAESTRKLSEGYLKINVPTGEPVWRKPRPSLSTYSDIKGKFPQSIEVLYNPGDLLSYAPSESAIISNWKIDLNNIVLKDEIICEICTDKVSVEVVAPHTGRLIWLLEEGIVFKSPICIALLIT